LPAEKKQAIEDALTQLKTAHQAKDIAACDTALESLNKAWEAASQDMYAAQQEPQQGANETEANGPDANNNASGDVEDVPYEEVK